jgi:hypothetical protein
MKRQLRCGANVIYKGDIYRINSTSTSNGVRICSLTTNNSIVVKKHDLTLTLHDKNDLIKYNKNFYIIKNIIYKDNEVYYDLELPNKYYKQNGNTSNNVLSTDPRIKNIPSYLQEKFTTFLKFIDKYNTTIQYLNKKTDKFQSTDSSNINIQYLNEPCDKFQIIDYDDVEEIMDDLIIKCKFNINQLSRIEYTLKKTLNPSFQICNITKNPFDLITQEFQLITFDKAEKIANEYNLQIDFQVKCEKWSYSLFNEEKTFYIRKFKFTQKVQKFCDDRKEKDIQKYLQYLDNIIIDIIIDGKDYKTTKYLLELERNMSDMTMDLFYDKNYDIPDEEICNEINNFEIERRKVFNKPNYSLEPEQKASVIKSIKNKLSIITGYPGTGKTEIVCCILYILYKFYKKHDMNRIKNKNKDTDTDTDTYNNPFSNYVYSEDNIEGNTDHDDNSSDENIESEKYVDPKTIGLMAPTGLAGLNLQKNIFASHFNKKISGTCHKILLNVFQNIKNHKENCTCRDKEKCEYSDLEGKLFVIDESSMVDTFMFYEILKMCKYFDSRLIIIGDVNQLPSVGAGVVLKNLINSHCFDVTKLVNIKRQDAGSLVNSIKQMNESIIRETEFEDESMSIINIREFIQGDKINRELLLNMIKRNNLDQHNSRFITYFRTEKYLFNTNAINNLLQDIYNPNGSIISPNNRNENGNIFKISDKIIRIENDYSSEKMRANGEQAKITDYDGKIATIIYDDGCDKPESIGINELYENFRLNYCTTIHSAQGSQYENVVFFIQPGQSYIIDKTSVYTAISRAKNKCFVVTKNDDFIRCQENIKNSDSKVSLFMKESNNYDL